MRIADPYMLKEEAGFLGKKFSVTLFALMVVALMAGCSFSSQGRILSSDAAEAKNQKMEKTTNSAAGKTKITLTSGDTVIEAVLDDNETAKAFAARLPILLPMKRYDDREYYGRITKLPETGPFIPDFSNGDVTYYPGGPSFAVFFAKEKESHLVGLVRMGRITSDLSLFNKLGESPEVRIEVKK